MAEKTRLSLRRWWQTKGATIAGAPLVLALGAALAAACVVYRIELAGIIYFGKDQPVSLQSAQVPLAAFLKTALPDLFAVIFLTLVFAAGKIWMETRTKLWRDRPFTRLVEGLAAAALVLGFTLLLRVHFQLLLQLETGLTFTLVVLASRSVGWGDFFQMISLRDAVFIFAPLAVFWLVLKYPGWLRRNQRRLLLGGFAAGLVLQLVPSTRLSQEIAENAGTYFLKDVLNDARKTWFAPRNSFDNRRDLPGAAQMNSIALVDVAFVSTNQPVAPPPARPVALTATGKPWNIVLFVLESTGTDYIFDDAHGRKEPPMPFLQKIMRESFCLANHQASANSSSQAAFSIFTGLYPPPTHSLSTMSETLSIPTLNRYLGTNYHFFLVHPTEAGYSFPEHLFLNNGLTEFDNLNNLPPSPHPGKLRLARNEIDTVDFFNSRLEQVRQPFLAAYWSFIPHHPYSDYGPEFRIRSDRDNPRDRYYNNLRCLDVQIKRVFEQMTKVGLLDQTLFVFVGDHGEAFNQHPNVWIHSFGSYGEMYRVPMFFWQPKLIAPQTIDFFTSHVDITPTLLDLLGVPFDAARFQGVSVLRGEPNRKYIFSMDARAVFVNAIGRDRKKVSLCFNDDEALAFDLAKDPAEKYPLNEYRFPEQTEALFKFCNYQKQLVEDYNQAILAGRQFPPKMP